MRERPGRSQGVLLHPTVYLEIKGMLDFLKGQVNPAEAKATARRSGYLTSGPNVTESMLKGTSR